MKDLLTARDEIQEHIYGAGSSCKWTDGASHVEIEKYCIAKDTIQDTAEALMSHREQQFSSDIGSRYIEYYGVLQAVYLQQDSILALHSLFGVGKKLNVASLPSWNKVREMRNDTVGHPVGRLKRLNRNQISYEHVHYMTLKKEDVSTWESLDIDLGELIDAYEVEAVQVLTDINKNMVACCEVKHT